MSSSSGAVSFAIGVEVFFFVLEIVSSISTWCLRSLSIHSHFLNEQCRVLSHTTKAEVGVENKEAECDEGESYFT